MTWISSKNGIAKARSRILTFFTLIFLCNVCLFTSIATYNLFGERFTAKQVEGTVSLFYPIPIQNGGVYYRVHLTMDDGTQEVFNLLPSLAFGSFDTATQYGWVKTR